MVHPAMINMKRLWELVQEGKSAKEIMKELDISEMAALQNAVTNLASEKGETINVPGLIGKASVDQSYSDTGAKIHPDMPKHK